MQEKILIAVYDSLCQDGENWEYYLDLSEYVGTYYTEPIYNLFSISKEYGGLTKDGNTSVKLELYYIDEYTLKLLEHYYGENTINSKNPYGKDIISTSYGDCFIWFYNGNVSGKPLIESGDYIKFKEYLKKEIKMTENLMSRHGME